MAYYFLARAATKTGGENDATTTVKRKLNDYSMSAKWLDYMNK